MSSQTHGWIKIRGLRIEGTRVGIYPHELTHPQHLVVDVGLWADVVTAAASHHIADTIDYDEVVATIRHACTHQAWSLVESLVEDIAKQLLQRFPRAEVVTVEVHKPSALPEGHVSVAIERARG
jgi:dihydroneopterin aldolase